MRGQRGEHRTKKDLRVAVTLAASSDHYLTGYCLKSHAVDVFTVCVPVPVGIADGALAYEG